MDSVKKPTLLINKNICQSNIQKMADHARMNQVSFRPHFKTHQSAEIGNWFRAAGVNAITVTSLQMATSFADEGWNDITIAFPVNLRELEEINRLAATVSLNVLIESAYSMAVLAGHMTNQAGFFIKIDTGYHRTGVDPDDLISIDAILDASRQNSLMVFKGFLTHTGQTYAAKDMAEIMKFQVAAGEMMLRLKHKYQPFYPEMICSTGDTPSCSLFDPYPGIDEIRPGNFVFYDLMQSELGSCSLTDIAVALACPVVAVHPERSEAVIYGGAVHLSKESLNLKKGVLTYGLAVQLTQDGWETSGNLGYVSSLSQEHGIIRLEGGNKLRPGDLIAILPVHSCLCMDAMIHKPQGIMIIE